MIINTISNERRLNLIRKFSGNDEIEQINKEFRNLIKNSSESFKNIIEFFSLLDSSSSSIKDLTPYSIGNRKIKIIQNNSDLNNAINTIQSSKIIAFDSEQRPTFKKNQPSNGIALIQLSNANECYLIQVKKINNINPLIKLLENENIIKVGINLKGDKEALYEQYSLKMKSTIDLDEIFNKLTAKQNIGAKKASMIFLKQDLQKSKKATISNWEISSLSEQQIKYASEDASVVFDIIIRLIKDYPFIIDAMPKWFQNKLDKTFL